jgi:hypothetical protein
MPLPPEYRFDVEKAVRELASLADSEPDTLIALTLAQVGDDGLEGESEGKQPGGRLCWRRSPKTRA